MLGGLDLEELKMKREVIHSQVVLFHLLGEEDRAFLKASLRVDPDTELSEQLVMVRASTVPCNSKEFSYLFELCSHFRHRPWTVPLLRAEKSKSIQTQSI